mmetsp:Transcript_25604/g.81480  ORF Transcript_25604/g.81480 Transcript_25604/m.81480 type:complete len:506 (-) Transcript_25604:106-1623(-)
MASAAEEHEQPRAVAGLDAVPAGTDRSKCFWACMATCASNGALYMSPMFTEKLIGDVGFTSANVVIFGVLLALGHGSLTYPFSRFYNHLRTSPATTDRLATVITSAFIISSTGVLAIVLRQPQPSAALVATLFLVWGIGLGWSFFHAMCLTNFLFADDNAKRRRAVASMSFAMGGGSLLFPIGFHFITSSLSLADNFAILTLLYAAIGAGRWRFMYRARFAPLSDDEPAIVSSTAIPTASNPIPPVTRVARLGARDYLRNSIVWFTLISSFFAHGVGSTYNSAIGNFANDLDVTDVEKATFAMSMAFVSSSLTARITNTVLYTLWDWPFVMVLWQCFLICGIVIYCSTQTALAAFVASVFVGLSHGGVSACLHVVASTCFPGTTADTGFNLALAFTLLSVSPPLLGYIQTVVYKAASLAAFGNGTLATFFFFLGAAIISTASGLMLGVKLKDRNMKLANPLGAIPAASGASHSLPSLAQTLPIGQVPFEEDARGLQHDALQIELA